MKIKAKIQIGIYDNKEKDPSWMQSEAKVLLRDALVRLMPSDFRLIRTLKLPDNSTTNLEFEADVYDFERNFNR